MTALRGQCALLAMVGALVGCRSPPRDCNGTPWTPTTLTVDTNPFGPSERQWAPQPHRDNPTSVATWKNEAWVALQGSVDEPGEEVVVVDLDGGPPTRIPTGGAGPSGVAISPDGAWVVVFNRFSDAVGLLHRETRTLVARLPTDFYATEGVFTRDGRGLWVTNRWRDAVQVWPVSPSGQIDTCGGVRVPVGANPRDIAISEDGQTIAVAALTGMTVSLIDQQDQVERRRVELGAPANGLAFAGGWLVVATTSAATHHPARTGPDGDGDGHPGDGTPNVNFQDLQNELAVIDPQTGEIAHRYTSDSICCHDYRDVDPADSERLGELLPPPETWIVGGALPEQVVAGEDADGPFVWVTYSASNELQRFDVDPATGALRPRPVKDSINHNPHGIALSGERLVVAHRLGETLGIYDRAGDPIREVVVGDLSGGDFPATDAEIGELFNSVTAPFTVDGDQSCVHCHREGSNIDKAFSMPLTRAPGLGSRMAMAYRAAMVTRPWFMEAAMDENNFRPVINEFARIENFCCSDYTLFPDGAPADCADNPPLDCAESPNTGSRDGFAADREGPFLHPRPTEAVSRDGFFLDAAEHVLGRTESFGDGVFYEDVVTGDVAPVLLDLDGITRTLGLFLIAEPRLLPNPNIESASVQRGQALFESPATGCAGCHPPPTFTISTDHDTAGVPVRVGPVVSPMRGADGTNLDLLASGFIDTFPEAEQDACEDVCDAAVCTEDPAACDDLRTVYFGVPTLLGLWDRAPSMLHDGRANGLREVLCTPGHSALRDGEQGFNERDGAPDTHGATSHLSPDDVRDLEAYLMSL